jgi:hypothetical protein
MSHNIQNNQRHLTPESIQQFNKQHKKSEKGISIGEFNKALQLLPENWRHLSFNELRVTNHFGSLVLAHPERQPLKYEHGVWRYIDPNGGAHAR